MEATEGRAVHRIKSVWVIRRAELPGSYCSPGAGGQAKLQHSQPLESIEPLARLRLESRLVTACPLWESWFQSCAPLAQVRLAHFASVRDPPHLKIGVGVGRG